jgi:uncharacterized protein (DUF433 family)/DNA-binding transcriptional MerR regulator
MNGRSERSLRFDVPLYSISDAARHIHVSRSTFATWARGYSQRPAGRTPVIGEPVITSIRNDGGPSIPFIGLAEGFVLAAFREAGVPLQRIRPALAKLQEELGIEHVLASRSLYTDGAELLYDFAESHGDTPEARSARQLVVARNDQLVFREIVESYLRRIEFAPDAYARVIHLPQYRTADVIIDPERAYGLPIFASGAARVEIVLRRFKAGESLPDLSEEFGVPVDQLVDVLRVHTDAAA